MAEQRLSSEIPSEYRLRCPYLPLAVYQEVAAHLRQVNGVEVQLLRQPTQDFDYRESQIGGIQIRHTIDDEAG